MAVFSSLCHNLIKLLNPQNYIILLYYLCIDYFPPLSYQPQKLIHIVQSVKINWMLALRRDECGDGKYFFSLIASLGKLKEKEKKLQLSHVCWILPLALCNMISFYLRHKERKKVWNNFAFPFLRNISTVVLLNGIFTTFWDNKLRFEFNVTRINLRKELSRLQR